MGSEDEDYCGKVLTFIGLRVYRRLTEFIGCVERRGLRIQDVGLMA